MAKRITEELPPDLPKEEITTPKFIQVHVACGDKGKVVVGLDDEMCIWQWVPVHFNSEKGFKMRWVKLVSEI